MNDTIKKLDEEFYELSRCWDIASSVRPLIDDYLHHRDAVIIEAVREIVRKEKVTWARESIGWKAVESIENALSTLK